MKFSDILKAAAVAAVVYGAYKLGENQGKKSLSQPSPSPVNDNIEEAEVVETSDEKDFIVQLIESLKNKPNKTSKDKNTLELLQIKLNQLLKGK